MVHSSSATGLACSRWRRRAENSFGIVLRFQGQSPKILVWGEERPAQNKGTHIMSHTLPLRSLAILAKATAHGSSEGLLPGGQFTLPGVTTQERQNEAERRILSCCTSLGLPFSPSLEQYRADLATWA